MLLLTTGQCREQIGVTLKPVLTAEAWSATYFARVGSGVFYLLENGQLDLQAGGESFELFHLGQAGVLQMLPRSFLFVGGAIALRAGDLFRSGVDFLLKFPGWR